MEACWSVPLGCNAGTHFTPVINPHRAGHLPEWERIETHRSNGSNHAADLTSLRG
jgi:hypothetical protein